MTLFIIFGERYLCYFSTILVETICNTYINFDPFQEISNTNSLEDLSSSSHGLK